ncbi:hypothetical protein [Streptomyces neyagawaensis]|nr:hypothetical protein [Streptomyces neyagawaensis]MDE1686942.1 hypothetical protein [Streptomyces neyagawaensis]
MKRKACATAENTTVTVCVSDRFPKNDHSCARNEDPVVSTR